MAKNQLNLIPQKPRTTDKMHKYQHPRILKRKGKETGIPDHFQK